MPNQTKHECKVAIDEMEVHRVHTLRRSVFSNQPNGLFYMWCDKRKTHSGVNENLSYYNLGHLVS